jgi:hypothetical protein
MEHFQFATFNTSSDIGFKRNHWRKKILIVYADMDVNAGSDTLISTGLSQQQKDAEITKFQTIISAEFLSQKRLDYQR